VNNPEVGDVLLIRQSARRQLPSLLGIAVVLTIYVLLGVFGNLDRWLMWMGVIVFGSSLVAGLIGLVIAHRSSWELRLDPDGVTVAGQAVRPWSDFAEVRITGMRPRWIFWWSFGYRVVSFIGKPGVVLPTLPSIKRAGALGGSARLRDRWYGTQLILMPQTLDASTDTIANAVQRFSDVPVRRL
jgi:hypothetical protein